MARWGLGKTIPRSRSSRGNRTGASAVEFAIIGPALLMMLLGLLVLGLGTFRCNQVTALAHEGVRWAAVRGKVSDRLNNRSTAVTATELYNEVIKPRAMALDLQKLTYELNWSADRRSVSVTINYCWGAEAFFGQRNITCTSTMLVSN